MPMTSCPSAAQQRSGHSVPTAVRLQRNGKGVGTALTSIAAYAPHVQSCPSTCSPPPQQMWTTGRISTLQLKQGSRVTWRCRHAASRAGAAVAAAAVHDEAALQWERMLTVKLSIASSTGRLDLSNCGLRDVPEAVWELTELQELSLAGNELHVLPAAIGNLTSLQRLQLSGNWLTQLPSSLGQLTALEGLWVHGNLLEHLPETLGNCEGLRQLSVAGNRLTTLPSSIGDLHLLEDLACGGNLLESLPETLQGLSNLTKLALHGNRLSRLPEGIGLLPSLKELWLQGNCLQCLPDNMERLLALAELSVADNRLTHLPARLPQQLRSLWAYGNLLQQFPVQVLQLPVLRHLWLEGNPFSATSNSLATAANSREAHGLARLTVGLDQQQLAVTQDSLHAEEEIAPQDKQHSWQHKALLHGQEAGINCADNHNTIECHRRHAAAAAQQLPGEVAVSTILGSMSAGSTVMDCPGYFKLQYGSGSATQDNRVLVVAFGSAPGTPNWGGLLSRVWKSAGDEDGNEALTNFDILYVVDPARAWYGGGDQGWLYFQQRLQRYTELYRHVVMLGDSMGATAALLAAPLASTVHAFCPQVDLISSSIRPARPVDWMDRLTQRCRESVTAALGVPTTSSPREVEGVRPSVHVHVGSWEHDLQQAQLLPQHAVQLHVYREDSHRLALLLDQRGKLVPILQQAILHELGLSLPACSKVIRLSNLL